MRSILSTVSLVAIAVALSGCGTFVATSDAAVAPKAIGSGAPASAPSSIAPASSVTDRTKAICQWAVSAGIDKMNVSMLDTSSTKKEIAALHESYKVTCIASPKATAPAPNIPPAVPSTPKP